MALLKLVYARGFVRQRFFGIPVLRSERIQRINELALDSLILDDLVHAGLDS